MSSNRLLYDSCALQTQIKDSTSSLSYRMYLGNYKNCNNCPGDYTNDLDFGARVDVETELRNQGVRLQSKCPGTKYDPKHSKQGANITPHHMCHGLNTPHNQKMPTKSDFNLSTNCCK